ncbi:hypothetical protein RDV64_03395 [Acuticoccus sp. MNP-M23]|uniref:hypothetical protein n=1 Tax=Acuticoccus sp. MNP-M23 TaxID=3072793 RepID=UPI0028159EC4|nr:hypothetical protein [Acuticoccus sp. MNP-M23]WMS43459.1 hypothetical protein RDV64_03395 [Acuticoccus sp. MNP-M23]
MKRLISAALAAIALAITVAAAVPSNALPISECTRWRCGSNGTSFDGLAIEVGTILHALR